MFAKENKVIAKARAVVLKDEKFILLRDKKRTRSSRDASTIHKMKLHLIGGNIEENEDPKDAVVREVFEETKIVVRPIKLLFVNNYSLKMTYQKEHFLSKRKEYIFLCEYVSGSVGHLFGVDGEFVDDIEMVELNIDEIGALRLGKKIVSALNIKD